MSLLKKIIQYNSPDKIQKRLGVSNKIFWIFKFLFGVFLGLLTILFLELF